MVDLGSHPEGVNTLIIQFILLRKKKLFAWHHGRLKFDISIFSMGGMLCRKHSINDDVNHGAEIGDENHSEDKADPNNQPVSVLYMNETEINVNKCKPLIKPQLQT